MTEMVERVARAIYLKYANHPDARWECVDPAMQENVWRSHARAAIEAMREPTEAMNDAGFDKLVNHSDLTPNGVWNAMIDAALTYAP